MSVDNFGLRAQLTALERLEASVRRGDDPESLRRFRVATRRSRTMARALRPQLDVLAGELAWLGGVLGAVRDLDVLLARIRTHVADLDVDRPAGDELVAAFERERAIRHADVLGALSSSRYRDLLDRLAVEAAVDGDVRAVAAKAFRRFARRARHIDGDEAMHELRKAAKGARYTAELLPARRAVRYVDALRSLQDIVGAYHDAVVVEERLRSVARAHTAVAAGRLIAAERSRRDTARAALQPAIVEVLRRGDAVFQ